MMRQPSRVLLGVRYISCSSNSICFRSSNSDDKKENSFSKPNLQKSAAFDVDDMLLESSDISKDSVLNEIGQNMPQANFNIDEMILKSSTSSSQNDEEKDGFDMNEDEEEYMNDDDIRVQILNVALEYVPTHGWSNRSIEEAVKTLELSPGSAGMFKRCGADLVLHFIEECNNALSDHMAAEANRNKEKKINQADFIEKAIQTRLKMITPYIESWGQALTLLASPIAAADCLENGAHMVDEIWYHAGDMSTDMSWYTKRGAVAAIYASTELYMLRDNSVDFNDTWDFLHRRMQDFESAAITKNSFAHAMNDFYALACAGYSTAQNIMGMNSKNR